MHTVRDFLKIMVKYIHTNFMTITKQIRYWPYPELHGWKENNGLAHCVYKGYQEYTKNKVY